MAVLLVFTCLTGNKIYSLIIWHFQWKSIILAFLFQRSLHGTERRCHVNRQLKCNQNFFVFTCKEKHHDWQTSCANRDEYVWTMWWNTVIFRVCLLEFTVEWLETYSSLTLAVYHGRKLLWFMQHFTTCTTIWSEAMDVTIWELTSNSSSDHFNQDLLEEHVDFWSCCVLYLVCAVLCGPCFNPTVIELRQRAALTCLVNSFNLLAGFTRVQMTTFTATVKSNPGWF